MNRKLLRLFVWVASTSGLALLIGSASQSEPAKVSETKPAQTKAADAKNEETLAAVIPPEQFFGPPAMGYAAAKSCPHTCHNLFCYCGCDITDSHKSLLDCFTGYHGVDCHICQEEAMLALRMTRNDEPIGNIQKAIDQQYSNMYPFKQDSPALKHYKSVRKWQPATGAAETSSSSSASAPSSSSPSCCSTAGSSSTPSSTPASPSPRRSSHSYGPMPSSEDGPTCCGGK